MEDFEKRKFIRDTMEQLDKLSKDNFDLFEVALVIWLRSDLFQLDYYIDDSDIEKIEKVIKEVDSILDDDIKDKVDNLCYNCEDLPF